MISVYVCGANDVIYNKRCVLMLLGINIYNVIKRILFCTHCQQTSQKIVYRIPTVCFYTFDDYHFIKTVSSLTKYANFLYIYSKVD